MHKASEDREVCHEDRRQDQDRRGRLLRRVSGGASAAAEGGDHAGGLPRVQRLHHLRRERAGDQAEPGGTTQVIHCTCSRKIQINTDIAFYSTLYSSSGITLL